MNVYIYILRSVNLPHFFVHNKIAYFAIIIRHWVSGEIKNENKLDDLNRWLK